MKKYLYCLVVVALLGGCSPEPSGEQANGDGGGKSAITGPFPKTISGTIGYSYPLEDGSGRIKLGLLEYDTAAIIIGADTYDAKGMEQDDAEVTLTVEPMVSDQCGEDEQCFRGY